MPNDTIPLPEPFYTSGPFYTADHMREYAAAVSAAKDAEAAQLRADAIDRQNNVVMPLRRRVDALEDEVAGLREDAEGWRESRGMFVARLESMAKQGDKWLTITAVMMLLDDCDMLAARKGTT